MIKSFHERNTGSVQNVESCFIEPSSSGVAARHSSLGSDATGVDEDDESVSILNELDKNLEEKDATAISLLKQIFPEETAENLRKIHVNRCVAAAAATASNTSNGTDATVGSSNAPDALTDASQRNTEKGFVRRQPIGNGNIRLPDHFLRLPHEIAVRRFVDGTWRYQFVKDLSKRAIRYHERRYGQVDFSSLIYCTKVLHRDIHSGLGMTLVAFDGTNNGALPLIRVHALSGLDGHSRSIPVRTNVVGPALSAGVLCNDILIGVNGIAFAESFDSRDAFVPHVFSRIRDESDPVILHLLRPTTGRLVTAITENMSTASLLDTGEAVSDEDSCLSQIQANVSLQSDLSCSQATSMLFDDSKSTPSNAIRPFIRALMNSNLLSSREEQVKASRTLDDFDHRANQWDLLSAYLLPSSETLLPLVGVRKALSVRIVNMFDDEIDTAYTIWVYDAEAGKEWYAPVRYFRDFEDLRAAILPLCTGSIQQIPFPLSKHSALNMFLRSPNRTESNIQRETKCRQLEYFLRTICAMIYKVKIHPFMAEVAIYVQSFLGCDTQDESGTSTATPLQPLPQYVDLRISAPNSNASVEQERIQFRERLRLKRSIQCATYRLFLLDTMDRAVGQFVDRLRTQGPRMQDIEELESQGRDILKSRAMADLMQIQAFLDKVQEMILEGCRHDFERISKRMEYVSIHPLIRGSESGDSGYWEKLVREAVREQVEVEVYVPLRSVVSRWLVYGWRHEDMEVHFRMKELRCRPSNFFRLVVDEQANYDWKSVTKILNEGVGLSTLPCMKLRAIVDASREIFRIIQRRNEGRRAGHFGADDFLPIFIYCVVQAEVERPCALCVLLRTLCDRMNKTGEIGYYLLTFEAAIRHCEEVDLTEPHRDDEMPSFQSIELDDN
jgi:Vacuolar sorting protein 9 (VPS9) domain